MYIGALSDGGKYHKNMLSKAAACVIVYDPRYLALAATRLASSSFCMLCWYTLRTKNALPSMSYTTAAERMSPRGCVGGAGAPARASAIHKSLLALWHTVGGGGQRRALKEMGSRCVHKEKGV